MKFNKIKLSEKITQTKGIKNIDIERLSNVIALVGKNGSGKTRILDLIEENLFKSIKITHLFDNSIEGLPHNLKSISEQLSPFKDFLINRERILDLNNKRKENPNKKSYIDEIRNLQNDSISQLNPNNSIQVNKHIKDFNSILPKLKTNYLRRIKSSEIQLLQDAIASKNEDKLSFEDLIENVVEINEYDEFKSIHKSALKYLSKLPHQLTFDFMECLGDKEKYEKRVSHKRFISLKKLINDFLNKELSWKKKSTSNSVTENGVQSTYFGIWKLDNREFNYLEFSDGEKTLFAYALLFFLIDANPNLNIKNSVILVDEPELHLHPDSEIELINGMRNAIGEKGQLIFATHSINILSHLNYDEIFMIKKGEISHPSQATLGNSISELMGLEERVNKLSNFLSSISTWTFVNFMAECFSNPEVIQSSKPDDPQLQAFKKAITQNLNKTKNMLLDFGAGKGRLFEQIKSDYDFIKKINYSALEPEVEYHDLLINQGAKKVFKHYSELPKNNFDFILLCNVLHEVPISEWLETLNNIVNSLSSEGYLIIIEAKVLTKGEKIGKEGFILLDIDEIKTLFNLNDSPTSIEISGKENLITCVVISNKVINPIKKPDILKTLQTLQNNTLNKIIELRESYDNNSDSSIGIGRKNAFLSQLHINSQIALLKLNET